MAQNDPVNLTRIIPVKRRFLDRKMLVPSGEIFTVKTQTHYGYIVVMTRVDLRLLQKTTSVGILQPKKLRQLSML